MYIVPVLATVPYVWDAFLLGQINVTLLALILGAFLALRRGRPWRAGALLGIAAAAKVFPLPVVAYFAVRRSGAAVAGTFAALALVLVVLPAPVRGWDRNLYELRLWATRMLGDQTGDTIAQRNDIAFTRRNQSLESVAHRLLRPVVAGDWDGREYTVNVADLPPQACRLVGLAGCLALGIVILVAARGRFAVTPLAEAMEAAMVLALAVLCSPLAWTYFFCWLLPGWAVAAYVWRQRPDLGRRPLAGFVLSGLLAAGAFTELFEGTPQAYGVTAWSAVAMILTLGVFRWREARSGATAEPSRGRKGAAPS